MKKNMHQSRDNKYIPMTSTSSGKGREIKKDVYYYTNQIVNIIMVGNPEEGKWVLIDAGMPKSGKEIISVAQNRFGRANPPSAILLTHGHLDHIGGLVEMIEEWNVPVYAHPLEFPYLTGEREYPKPDPSIEGGLLAKVSFIYPTEPINIKSNLHPLPSDHRAPDISDWVWVCSPGHSPGHVSFYRKDDRLLLSGDAFITVRQDSLYKVLIQEKEVNGPPKYLTTDWKAAWDSVKNLEMLRPKAVIPGHGKAMEGKELEIGLKSLVQDFEKLAIPKHGKYVEQ
jgi:glyoxylase-like metal-dependent hydrolase (beta-lactamase superfamily II)